MIELGGSCEGHRAMTCARFGQWQIRRRFMIICRYILACTPTGEAAKVLSMLEASFGLVFVFLFPLLSFAGVGMDDDNIAMNNVP
jgi:hypothetical protein